MCIEGEFKNYQVKPEQLTSNTYKLRLEVLIEGKPR